jgi:ATP/maltotriose-dependent transcriptional regulator MalT
MEIAYSYAVARLARGSQTFDPELATRILRELLATRGYGSRLFSELSVRSELGAALLELGQLDAACEELESSLRARESIGQPTLIPRLQLATAHRLRGDQEMALRDLASVRSEARKILDFLHYAIACEQQSRLLFDQSRPDEASRWLELARWTGTEPSFRWPIEQPPAAARVG